MLAQSRRLKPAVGVGPVGSATVPYGIKTFTALQSRESCLRTHSARRPSSIQFHNSCSWNRLYASLFSCSSAANCWRASAMRASFCWYCSSVMMLELDTSWLFARPGYCPPWPLFIFGKDDSAQGSCVEVVVVSEQVECIQRRASSPLALGVCGVC